MGAIRRPFLGQLADRMASQSDSAEERRIVLGWYWDQHERLYKNFWSTFYASWLALVSILTVPFFQTANDLSEHYVWVFPLASLVVTVVFWWVLSSIHARLCATLVKINHFRAEYFADVEQKARANFPKLFSQPTGLVVTYLTLAGGLVLTVGEALILLSGKA